MSNGLKPLSGQEALNELCDYILGEGWYCVDPLGPTQVNAIIVDDIKIVLKHQKAHIKFLKLVIAILGLSNLAFIISLFV